MRLSALVRFAAASVAATLALAGSPAGAAPVERVTLVSARADGVKANGVSYDPSLSSDGRRVAFTSTATNLHPADTGDASDVYVKDLVTGAVLLASAAADGSRLAGEAFGGVLSGDGTKVAFALAPEPQGSEPTQVYVKNLDSGELTGFGRGGAPTLSDDGTTLAFPRFSGSGPQPVVVIALSEGQSIRVPEVLAFPSLSGDGSLLTGFGRRDEFGLNDVPLVNLATGEYTGLVGVHSFVSAAIISADGSTVAFSFAGNDNASFPFTVDVETLRLDEVGTPSTEVLGDFSFDIFNPFVDDLSATGDIAAGTLQLLGFDFDRNEAFDRTNVFVTDRVTGDSRFVAVRPDGAITTGTSEDASLDASGRLVAFTSTATDLVAADTDPGSDVYLADLGPRSGGDLGCTVFGTSADDALRGTPGDDVVCAGGGDDVVTAGGGDDVVYGADGADRLSGGPGDDLLYGMNGGDRVYGGRGSDRVQGDAGADTVFGGRGNDRIWGGAGDDVLHGGIGDDDVRAGGGADHVRSGPGRDYLEGNAGDDDIRAAGGDDRLHGNTGDDRLVCYADPRTASGVANGGAGVDTATRSCGRLLNVP